MSSKLLRKADTAEVASITWRPANGVSVQTSRTSPASRAGAPGLPPPDFAKQIEQRLQAAHQQGVAAGEAAAMQRVSQRIEPAIASLNKMVQELASVRKRFRNEAEQDTVKLAIAIGRRILHRELATDPEAILGLVKIACEKIDAREVHRLRVSPADRATLQELRVSLELPVGLEIVSDNSLSSGSAIFETARGELDASIDTQLSEIERGFADVLRRRSQ